jgi:hypothetical protein
MKLRSSSVKIAWGEGTKPCHPEPASMGDGPCLSALHQQRFYGAFLPEKWPEIE